MTALAWPDQVTNAELKRVWPEGTPTPTTLHRFMTARDYYMVGHSRSARWVKDTEAPRWAVQPAPVPHDPVPAPAPAPVPAPAPEPIQANADSYQDDPAPAPVRTFSDSVASWTMDLAMVPEGWTVGDLLAMAWATGLQLEIRVWKESDISR